MKQKKTLRKWCIMVSVIVIILVVIVVCYLTLISPKSHNLICKYDQGEIKIIYNDRGITDYKADNIVFNIEWEQGRAKMLGINNYIMEYINVFTSNTNGYCLIDGKKE